MKLKDCKIGVVVINGSLDLGHIIGFTYNSPVSDLSDQERFERTIPLVQFVDSTRGIHPTNMKIFKG